MRSYQPSVRSRLWFLWPFWSDTLEGFMVAVAIGGVVGSLWSGDLNFPALLITMVSYPVAILTRHRSRRNAENRNTDGGLVFEPHRARSDEEEHGVARPTIVSSSE
jgi:hypothetical protein